MTTHLLRVALVAALVTSSVSADAQMHGAGPMGGGRRPGPPAFLTHLFPPNLVMEHQQEIGLTTAQIDAIKQAMNDTQQQFVDLQWRLDAESEALGTLLAADHVDEKAVLAKFDQVTALEQQVKRVNFTLLVHIKNQLTPQQQAKLHAILPAQPFGTRGGPSPAP